MHFDFDAGKYAVYVWPAFAITAAAFVWMIADSLASARRWRRETERLQAQREAPQAVRRWIGFAPLIVLLALGALFAGYALKHDPHVQPHALVGKPVPAVTLPDLDTGAMVAVHDAPAGPRLINFYASWCAPCRVEAPQLMALKAQGVTLVGVAYKDEPAKTQAFLAELGDPFAAKLVDRSGRAGIEFGVTGVPETFLVGADGVILAKHSGPLTDADVQDMLKKLK